MKFSRYLLTPTQLNNIDSIPCCICKTKKIRYRVTISFERLILLNGVKINKHWANVYSKSYPHMAINICGSPRCYNMVLLGTDSRGFYGE